MASTAHVQLLDPETTALVSREKARQSHAARRSRSKSKDRLATATRSKSPLGAAISAAVSGRSRGEGSGRTTPVQRSMSPGRAIWDMWRRVAGIALRWSRAHYRDQLRVSGREHMSEVDCFDGDKMRKGRFERAKEPESEGEMKQNEELEGAEEDLVIIHPVVDGRLKDEGRR